MKIVNRNLEDALNLYKKKNYFQAKSAFLKILKTQKVPPDIFFILFEISKNLNELDEAENYLIKYIEFDKNNHIAFNNLGNLYLKKNKYKEAEKYYLKAINLKKDYLPSILNLALYYEGLGNIELAKEFYNKGLKISPKNIGIHFSLSKIDEKFISEKKIEYIKKLINSENLDEFNKACAYFLLAKNKRKKKEYESEIDYLKKAHVSAFNNQNDFNKKTSNYWLNFIPKIFNKFKFIPINAKEDKTKDIKPLFIIGLPRSGSTIVESIISSGTEKVINLGETNLINWSLVNSHRSVLFSTNKNSDDFYSINVEQVKKKLYSSLNNYENFDEKQIFFTEKSLENFFFVDLIINIFPNAKFIHTYRNIDDNIIAIFQKFLTNISWSHSLQNIVQYTKHYLEAINFFKNKYPDKILSVALEALTKNSQEVSKEIYKFSGLEWNNKALEFYKKKDLFSNTASNIQIRKKIQKYDYKKYKPYKKFIILYK